MSECDLIAGGDTGGDGGEGNGGDVRVEGETNPMSTSVTCLVRFEIGFELCESVRVLMAASSLPFPNDSFHLLGFFMTVGVDAGTGTGGSGGASGSDWRVAEAERVWRLSPWASI